MRIIQTLHAFNENAPGGCEVYTLRLSQALAERHDVTIVFPEEDVNARAVSEEATEIKGLRAIRLRRPPIRDVSEMYRSAALDDWFDAFLARTRPDVIHVEQLLRLSTGWLEVAHARGVPTVLTLQDFWYLCPAIVLLREGSDLCPGSRGGHACATCPRWRREWSQLDVNARTGALSRVRRGVIRMLGLGPLAHRQEALSDTATRLAISRALEENLALLNLPFEVVTPSQFLAREHQRRGVSRAIRHVPCGAPFEERVAKTPADGLRVGYLGFVAPHKGVHVLVEAVRRMRDAKVSLAIHGHVAPGYRDELDRIAADDPRIRFCGPYAPEDLPAIHAGLDVIVVPSLWDEVYGIVIAEALALGTPAIVSDRGGMPELVADGVSGFIVPAGDVDALADRLEELAADPARLASLQQGIEPPFTTRDNARELEALYDKARN